MRDFKHTSYSESAVLASCERKWWFRYLKDAGDEQSTAQFRGSLLHKLIAGWRLGDDSAAMQELFDRYPIGDVDYEERDRILWVYDRYRRHYGAQAKPRIVATELMVESELPDGSGLTIVTYVDEVVQLAGGGLWAVERKSMKDWRRLDLLEVDPQVTIVLWNLWNNDWPVEGLLYDAVRTHQFAKTKPTLASLKGEFPKPKGVSAEAHGLILKAVQEQRAYEAPLEDSFRLLPLVRNDEHVAEALAEIQAHVIRRNDLIVGDRQPMRNLDQHCGWCDYKAECWEGLAFGGIGDIKVVD